MAVCGGRSKAGDVLPAPPRRGALRAGRRRERRLCQPQADKVDARLGPPQVRALCCVWAAMTLLRPDAAFSCSAHPPAAGRRARHRRQPRGGPGDHARRVGLRLRQVPGAAAGVRRRGPAPVALLHAHRLRLRRGDAGGRRRRRGGPGRAAGRGRRRAGHRRRDEQRGVVWQFDIVPEDGWPAGPVTVTMMVGGRRPTATARSSSTCSVPTSRRRSSGGYPPGDAIPVTGEIFELRSVATDTQKTGVPATFKLRVVDADGHVRAPPTASRPPSDGASTPRSPARPPPAWTRPRDELPRDGPLELVDARYDDPTRSTAARGPRRTAPAGTATVSGPPDRAGARELLRLLRRLGQAGRRLPVHGAREELPAAARDRRAGDDRRARRHHRYRAPTWDAGTIPAARRGGPGIKENVFEAKRRHARPGSADRLEGPLEHGHAQLRRRRGAVERAVTARR